MIRILKVKNIRKENRKNFLIKFDRNADSTNRKFEKRLKINKRLKITIIIRTDTCSHKSCGERGVMCKENYRGFLRLRRKISTNF